jgi:hypothetical protein
LMSKLDAYRKLRHEAVKLPDRGGYELAKGEMNPIIVERFAELLVEEDARTAWEPFANPDGRTFSVFGELRIKLTAASLSADHPDIVVADSLADEPSGDFDGVLFHPPYFGSSPFTSDPRDMSRAEDEDEWLVMMESAADIAVEHLTPCGIICAVGRRYRHGGKEVRLDEWMVSAFCPPMAPAQVWLSEPDVAVIMRWGE